MVIINKEKKSPEEKKAERILRRLRGTEKYALYEKLKTWVEKNQTKAAELLYDEIPEEALDILNNGGTAEQRIFHASFCIQEKLGVELEISKRMAELYIRNMENYH